ncbi:uncharacterized protein FFNC_06972 [Fusarium fujikuroi]|nr:uncharacterized protein FFNC_06972 [Fusarium fujikuroi]
MLTSRLLQLTVAILPRLAAAGSDPAAAYGTLAPPSLGLPDAVSNASSTIESEALLEECDPTITVCGTTANVRVVRTHNSTIFVTRHHVHEEITELPTSTRTVVEVIVSTNTTNIEGQCRDTTVYVEPTPLIVTVDVNTTTTREVVPIVNITSVTTSWVEHKKISQCIIKRTSTSLALGPSYSSAPPPPSAPSQQSPPAAGSGGNYNSGQPAPSVPSAGASSAQGSGSQRYVHVDEHFDQCPKNFADLWLTIYLLVLHHLLLPSRHPPLLKVSPEAYMEAHLGAFLGPQELRVPRVLPRPVHLRPHEALLDSRLII